MPTPSTWLPTPDGAEAAGPDGPGRPTPFWLRLLLVVAFHVVVLAGQWWALAPDVDDRWAAPGRVPTGLILLADVLFIPILLQVSSRVPMKVTGLVLLASLTSTYLLTTAVGDVYHNFAMHRSADVSVERVRTLGYGVRRVEATTGDDHAVVALATIPATGYEYWSERRHYRRTAGVLSYVQPMYGPWTSLPALDKLDLLVDDHGVATAVNADDDDTTPPGRAIALGWLALALLVWVPMELVALSCLTRRRGYWQLSRVELDAHE